MAMNGAMMFMMTMLAAVPLIMMKMMLAVCVGPVFDFGHLIPGHFENIETGTSSEMSCDGNSIIRCYGNPHFSSLVMAIFDLAPRPRQIPLWAPLLRSKLSALCKSLLRQLGHDDGRPVPKGTSQLCSQWAHLNFLSCATLMTPPSIFIALPLIKASATFLCADSIIRPNVGRDIFILTAASS